MLFLWLTQTRYNKYRKIKKNISIKVFTINFLINIIGNSELLFTAPEHSIFNGTKHVYKRGSSNNMNK